MRLNMQLDVLLAIMQAKLAEAGSSGAVIEFKIVKDADAEYTLLDDSSCGYEWAAIDYTASVDKLNEFIAVPQKPRLLLPDKRAIAVTRWQPSVEVGADVTVSLTGFIEHLKASPNAADRD